MNILKYIAELPALENLPQKNWDSEALMTVIRWGIAAAGIVAAGFIVVSAVTIATSQGDSTKTQKGIRGIIFASIGLIIVIAAEAITYFISGSVK